MNIQVKMLDNTELEKIGQYITYIAIIILFFFKTFQSGYKSIKEFFGKELSNLVVKLFYNREDFDFYFEKVYNQKSEK